MAKFKMSVEKRKDVYQKAIISMNETPRVCGFCYHLSEVAYNLKYSRSEDTAFNYFRSYYPEVYAQKPNPTHDGLYWFSHDEEGRKIRIKILEKAIEECNLLLEKSV